MASRVFSGAKAQAPRWAMLRTGAGGLPPKRSGAGSERMGPPGTRTSHSDARTAQRDSGVRLRCQWCRDLAVVWAGRGGLTGANRGRYSPGMETTIADSLAPDPSGRPTPPGGPLAARYEVLEEVGRGGMGVVYRARQKTLGRQVALKVTLTEASSERFLREAQLLAQIRSPHVVTVYECEVLPDGQTVLVMEWVDGNDLQQLMRQRGGPLPEAEVVPWMRQTCAGMAAAAGLGIIHRDLKPSNILLDADGRARVADFGLARGPEGALDLTLLGRGMMGTPYYMAPEQAENPRGVDTRADVYSFGATFYHALTGMPPFDGETAFTVLFKHKTEPLIPPRVRNPRLSERLNELLERCLAKSPNDRFPSFAEVRRNLEDTALTSP